MSNLPDKPQPKRQYEDLPATCTSCGRLLNHYVPATCGSCHCKALDKKLTACMAYDSEINGLTAIQPATGITAELNNGIVIIRRNKQIWKTTQSPELLERFMSSFVDIIDPKELKPFIGNIKAYKATEKEGKIIPGFVTGDLKYAKSWANEEAEFGGGIMVTMNISRADGQTKEAIILSVQDNDIIIPPGSPNVIDYAGDGKTEILVLRPTHTTQTDQ